MPFVYMRYVWDKPEINLKYVWYISKICLRNGWSMPDTYVQLYLSNFWKNKVVVSNRPPDNELELYKQQYWLRTGLNSQFSHTDSFENCFILHTSWLLACGVLSQRYMVLKFSQNYVYLRYPKIWLRYVWNMTEAYLRYTWQIPEIYLGYMRNV